MEKFHRKFNTFAVCVAEINDDLFSVSFRKQ